MNTRELEQILFEEIGYAGKPELVQGSDIPWINNRPIQGIEWAVLLNKIPIAYFSRFSDLDIEAIQALHKKVWSQSRAPFLFVTLPNEVRVYNGYEPPPLDGDEFDTDSRLLQNLDGLTDYLKARQTIRKQLVEDNHYERVYLETGAFWDTSESQRINHRNRADRQLVESMGVMRKMLTEDADLTNHIAYTLLGRSVFIRYLEDRGALPSELVNKLTGGKVNSYLDALQNRRITYRLYEQLSSRFNGDLFPVEAEESDVSQKHLNILSRFLSGEKLDARQLSLWPFNFEYIPIELISHIYDTFIEDQRASGAYYTPLLLADFILEETMGDGVIHPDMTVLDPACGSGIFLVGSYRRLIHAWSKENGIPAINNLNRILQDNIFGIDKNPEAIRIAAFSLYLEILNHLSNEQIRDETFRFPHIQNKNLLASDFFHEDLVGDKFSDQKFDRIVGNMPWGRGSLTDLGEEWLAKQDYIVGGKQAAPAFMLRAPSFCKNTGEIALLAPAKSTIHVTSETHRAFRDTFFSSFHVRAVVNFSALVYELFPGAISPTIATFYTPNSPDYSKKLVYGVPKPSPLSRHLKAILLDTTEIKFLNRKELLSKPFLWKVALFGTPRDAAIIDRLKSLPSLLEQANQLYWHFGQGFQINGPGKKKPARWLTGKMKLPTQEFRPYQIDFSRCQPIHEKEFYTQGSPELFTSPLVLIHQSQCSAAYSEKDIAYLHSISGISGNSEHEWLLHWLVAFINSPLAKYYHFLTSTRWAVERGNIIQREYQEMPFLIPNQNDQRFQKVLKYLDQIKNLLIEQDDFLQMHRDTDTKLREYKAAINELVYELHELHPIEQQQIEDTLEYGLEYFNWAKRKTRKPRGAKAVRRPDTNMLKAYAEIFARTSSTLLKVNNQALSATVYRNGAPLTVVNFEIVNSDNAQPVQVNVQPEAMRSKLRELDEYLLEQKAPSMYTRRHVRIYDGDQISLIRPSEQRFWTQSQARSDADAFLEELLE